MSLSQPQQGEKNFDLVLSQATGYGVVVGLGAAFAVLMLAFTWLQRRFTRFNTSNAAEFATASRSIKPGLICAGIVSAWTWSATLLQSSAATYQSGLSAAWWYGVGGTIQIGFFAAIAAKVKQNANGATTFLQIAKARYGVPCHLLFTFYCLVCAHIVSGSVILGASATINALTGMDIYACNFLLPIGIAVYVIAGGLRATFICDFTHTVILFVIIYMFMFSAFATSPAIGSPGKMYDLLVSASSWSPVSGNQDGSYLTMKSNAGILFGGCTIASGFSGVFCDQGYWQRAIASRPKSTTKAYMLGGLSWFAIPWAFGTTMGLASKALVTNPSFPTYPYALSAAQQSAGLVAPAAAVTLLGSGGAAAVLLVTFMAATSAASAELIAASSVVVYDIIGTYIRPLTGKQVVYWSHILIGAFGICFGAWSCILHAASIDLGWLFYVQGVALTPAVVPIGLTVCWNRMSHVSAFYGTLFGTVCGMTGWFVGCHMIYGTINVTNLALPYSAICGSAPGLVLSSIATIILAYLFPAEYDWVSTRAIAQADDDAPTNAKDDPRTIEAGTPASASHLASSPSEKVLDARKGSAVTTIVATREGEGEGEGEGEAEKDLGHAKEGGTKATVTAANGHSMSPTSPESDDGDDDDSHEKEPDRAELQRVFVRASWISGIMALIITIIIPLPMFFSGYIFSKSFFIFWISVAFIWVFCAGIFCIVLPVWESRSQITLIARGALGMSKRVATGLQ